MNSQTATRILLTTVFATLLFVSRAQACSCDYGDTTGGGGSSAGSVTVVSGLTVVASVPQLDDYFEQQLPTIYGTLQLTGQTGGMLIYVSDPVSPTVINPTGYTIEQLRELPVTAVDTTPFGPQRGQKQVNVFNNGQVIMSTVFNVSPTNYHTAITVVQTYIPGYNAWHTNVLGEGLPQGAPIITSMP